MRPSPFPLLFLSISLVLAKDNPNFWNVQLISDSSQRYLVSAQMVNTFAVPSQPLVPF